MSSNYVTLYDYSREGASVTMSKESFENAFNASVKCAAMVLDLAEQEFNLVDLYQSSWTTVKIDMTYVADELSKSLGIDHVCHLAGLGGSFNKNYRVAIQRDRITDPSDPRGYYVKTYITVSRETVYVF